MDMLLDIWGRVGSLNRLEEISREGEFDVALPFPREPSADTLGRALALGDAKDYLESKKSGRCFEIWCMARPGASDPSHCNDDGTSNSSTQDCMAHHAPTLGYQEQPIQ